MYRVGDYVYFECSSSAPFQIRRIEELNKTPNGNVEAKVMCFYRRRDLSSTLILLAGMDWMETFFFIMSWSFWFILSKRSSRFVMNFRYFHKL